MLPCRFVYIINTVTHLKFTFAVQHVHLILSNAKCKQISRDPQHAGIKTVQICIIMLMLKVK